ncbi:hypothetical protein cand_019520 [Cryptosporidium andersoni]|uniref:Uncharacterized protein n=1 Tax=Cryptosporidium andersoni TaxID=117008 RepID=A0A1J4MSM6_9CRYT|nr:hypothetical protein cand_019520 [Cryptosporidium andersoni]
MFTKSSPKQTDSSPPIRNGKFMNSSTPTNKSLVDSSVNSSILADQKNKSQKLPTVKSLAKKNLTDMKSRVYSPNEIANFPLTSPNKFTNDFTNSENPNLNTIINNLDSSNISNTSPSGAIATKVPNSSLSPEAVLADLIKNDQIKLPSKLDIPGKLDEFIFSGKPGLTPGVSSEVGRIRDNLDSLRNTFARFVEYRFYESTLDKSDLKSRIFMRNSLEKLKGLNYPTIKMKQWEEYQKMLIEEKKNLLLFQKHRSDNQSLDDAWCQTEPKIYEDFINTTIRDKLSELKKIKESRKILKKRLKSQGYLSLYDINEAKETMDEKFLNQFGLDNAFLDESEDSDDPEYIKYENLLDIYKNCLDSNNEKEFRELVFGNMKYRNLQNSDLIDVNEDSKKILRSKLVNYLDEKLYFSDVQKPWKWEQEFKVYIGDKSTENTNVRSRIETDKYSFNLVDIPKDFIKDMINIRKEYKQELINNEIIIEEMKGIINNCLHRDVCSEAVKRQLYNVDNIKKYMPEYLDTRDNIEEQQNIKCKASNKAGNFKNIQKNNIAPLKKLKSLSDNSFDSPSIVDDNLQDNYFESNRVLHDINILRSAAGILNMLQGLEKSQYVHYNSKKLKERILEDLNEKDIKLNPEEKSAFDIGVEKIIREILNKRK